MRKILVFALIFAFTLGAIPASASVNMFADVPADHWSYEAVDQLSRAGIVRSNGDRVYKGDKIITRYEMAALVANAMTKEDNATDEQKAIINKLADEFAPELEALNARVAKLEKKEEKADKKDNIKLSGEIRYRYEKTMSRDEKGYTRARINLFAPLTDKLVFSGRIEAENAMGTKAEMNVPHAFIVGKVWNFDPLIVGRIPLYLGQGLLSDGEGDAYSGADGVVLNFGSEKVKFTLAAGKAGVTDEYLAPGLPGNLYLQAANIKYLANKDLNITVAGIANKNKDIYSSYAAGFAYSGIKDIGLVFEYGKNNSNWAKNLGNGAAKGWMSKAKYLGADPAKEKSYGFWIGYRNADAFFDPYAMGTLESTKLVSEMDDIKGFEYGFEYTVFKNAVFKFQYNDLKTKENSTNQKNFFSSLTYSF